MLKRLAILSLLVWFSGGAWSQVPGNGSPDDQKPQGGRNAANPSQPLPARVNAEVSAAEEKKSADSKPSNYPWRELYGPANIPNWFLVLLGAGAVFAAVKTLRIISVQTNLMKDQLDRMVEKERARLKVQGGRFEVEGEPPGRWILAADLEIANHGPSTAYITQKRGNLAIVRNGEPLPELDESLAMLLPYPFDIIKPEMDAIHTAFYFEDTPSSLRELCIELAESRLVMYLYGFIEYETMGEGWHLPFRYRWEMSNIPNGTSEQDLATSINVLGGWDDPCSQENEEYRINPN